MTLREAADGMSIGTVLSSGEVRVSFVVVIAVATALTLGVGLWMIARPKQAWRFKHLGQFRDPEKVEPSGFAVGAAGERWNVVVPAAYQANRCSLAVGNGVEAFGRVLEPVVGSGRHVAEDRLQEFYVDQLTNDGLSSGWSSLCLRGSERTKDGLAEMQQALGEGLAIAARPGTRHFNANWGELRKLGGQEIRLRSTNSTPRAGLCRGSGGLRLIRTRPTLR